LFPPSWYRRATGNVSVGAQFEAGRHLDLSAGFFTDFSSAPRIEATSDTYSEPDVNHLGSTAAVAFQKNRYNVSVGFLALWGSGDGYALNADAGAGEPQLTRTTVTDRTFMIFVYGYTKAIEKALDAGYQKLTDQREEREEGEAAKTAAKKEGSAAQPPAAPTEASAAPDTVSQPDTAVPTDTAAQPTPSNAAGQQSLPPEAPAAQQAAPPAVPPVVSQ
jgi:hypothetical protein